MFQFTHPCGCDDYLADSEGFNQVSIHAPVWVRRLVETGHTFTDMFQFTHPCGCDFKFDINELTQKQFQFTHPCGCDGLTNTV